MPNLLSTAILFAKTVHEGKTRIIEAGLEPYFQHPVRVAGHVQRYTKDPEIIAAALLHDTLEETGTTELELKAVFGLRVARLVKLLTDEPVMEGRNRAARHESQLSRYLLMQGKDSIDVHSIKLADTLDNTVDLREVIKPLFYPLYLQEATDLLGVLVAGDHRLKRALAEQLGLDPTPYVTRTKLELS